MKIIQATTEHLDALATLFDGYRVFYKQESNIEAAKVFLKERITKQESVIYLAFIDNIAVGFTQLYPLFSSVSMKPMYLLNDLFINPNYRNKNIGTALINKTKVHCKEKGYIGLGIQTANTNPAQYLYQREGFVLDNDLQMFWSNK
jgi:GNAT superfamily N-acetyltransferase